MDTKHKHTQLIKEAALRLGFNAVGISKVEYLENEARYLKEWLNNGYHASMDYMQNHFEKRVNPSQLVEGAKSVISVLLNYYPAEKQEPEAPKISKYAFGKDYHQVIKDKLVELFTFINRKIKRVNGRPFVDSAPVLDKALAARSGLGWIGKNSCLINKNLGSFVFIGELIIDIELEYDKPINDFCGNCTKCLDACPTNAIISPKVIDSNRCISYHTIENKKKMPDELKDQFDNWIFGCDICQDVCPWNNKNSKPHQTDEFKPITEIIEMSAFEWSNLSEDEFNLLFQNSALKRAGYESIKKNIVFSFSGLK